MRLGIEPQSLLAYVEAPASDRPDHASPRLRAYLLLEVIVFFVGLPAAYCFGLLRIHPITLAIAVGSLIAILIVIDRRFDNRTLWNAADLRVHLRSILLMFLPAAVGIIGLVGICDTARLFDLPRENPLLWLAILAGYPLLSVYPQELIYRAFFFHRYRSIFRAGWPMIVVSAAVFAFMHVIFQNPFAVGLTFVGGLLFAWRFHATRSLLVATIEHSLYGVLMFSVGMARYFLYQGN